MAFDLRRNLVSGWQLPAALLLLGLALRMAWASVFMAGKHAQGEIVNTALAFARTGVLADAFQPGQGPTAHVLPLPPVYAGTIYRLFGIQSATSEMLLALSSSLLVVASFGLLYRAFGLMGTPRWLRLLALAFLCLAPMNINLEVLEFRIWDGGLSVFLAFAYLYALLRLERQAEIGWVAIAGMAFGAALLAFVHPGFGLAGYLCSLILMIEKLPARRWPGAALVAVAALGIVLTPWALRNQAQLGEPVLLRSNFGLELALANHPGAVNPADPRAVFRARMDELHPYWSKDAFARLKAQGEVAYARGLGEEAKAWIAAHPGDFAAICLRHAREFFFPPTWQWHIWGGNSSASNAKSMLHSLLSALGLAGALVAVVAAPRRYRFAAIMLLVPVLPYLIVQPTLRYRYISYALTVFFATDLFGRLLPQRLRGRRLLPAS